jgi:hypothetical protein
MNLENAKQALIDFQVKHENYLDASQKYQEYKDLPFWKKWVTRSVEAPRRDYLYEDLPIYRSIRGMMTIELRMYFSGVNKEITLAINEGGRGYKVDVNTGEKSYYLGRVNPVITESAKEILEGIRKELAPLIIE